jgi:hypothetical protein
MPIYRGNSDRELTEPELLSERFTESTMEQLTALRSRAGSLAGHLARRGARQPDDAPEPAAA